MMDAPQMLMGKLQMYIFFKAARFLFIAVFVCADGAGPESAADSHHQHPGDERNHSLCPALLLQIQGL